MRNAILFVVRQLLIFSLVFAFQPVLSAGSEAWAAKPKQTGPETQANKPAQPAMSFILVRSADCTDDCPEWISAEGLITQATPGRLKKFLKTLGDKKVPIVFHSEGGEVNAAYAMGRMIRKGGFETAVGGTRLEGCPLTDMRCKASIAKKGPSTGRSYSGGAYCVSACPLALAGGTSRVASQWAYIGVHQFTTIYSKVTVSYRIEYRMVNGRKQEVSRQEIGRKNAGQSKSTKLGKQAEAVLSAYLTEMGVSQDLIERILSASPETLRLLPSVEAMKLGLLTDMLASNESPGIRLCRADDPASARCHRHADPPVAEPATPAAQPVATAPVASGG